MDTVSILKQIPPIICIGPSRGIITWISLASLKDEGFTRDRLIQLIEKIQDERTRESELQALDKVLELLVKAGLLTESDGELMRSDDFPTFKELLDQFSSSSTKLLAWAVHFLQARNRRSISMSQLVATLSFSDGQIRDELPHLSVWKQRVKDDFSTSYKVPLLTRRAEYWEISGQPYASRRPIVLGDLTTRLHTAIVDIASSRRTFIPSDVIRALRGLEEASVQRTIRRLGLRSKGRSVELEGFAIESHIGEETRRRLVRVIRQPRMGLKYVRVEGRRLYEGDPFSLIPLALGEIFECDKLSSSADEFRNRCEEIIQRWNPELRSFGFQLELQKAIPWGLPPGEHYAIRFKRYPKPESKGRIIERYNAVQICRTPESEASSMWSKLSEYHAPREKELFAYLGEKRKDYSPQLSQAYSEIVLFLNWWRKELRELVRRDENHQGAFLLSSGFGELTNILISSFNQAYAGFFRSAFISFRDAMEWLSLTVFLDCIRMKYQHMEFGPLRDIYHELIQTGDWHKAREGLQQGIAILANPKDLKEGIESRIFEPNKTEIEARGITKENLAEAVAKHMSLPLLLLSTATVRCPKHVGESKYGMNYGDFQQYLGYELARVIALLEEGKDYRPWISSEDWDALAEKCKGLSLSVPANCSYGPKDKPCGIDADVSSVFLPKLPSTKVLLYLAGKRLGLPDTIVGELMDRYDDYSCLVHPYPQTMQYSPFSSGDEVQLWVGELRGLLRSMSLVLCNLVVYLRSAHDESKLGRAVEVCGKCRYFSSEFELLDQDIIRKKRWIKSLSKSSASRT